MDKIINPPPTLSPIPFHLPLILSQQTNKKIQPTLSQSMTTQQDTRFNEFVYLQAQNAGFFLGQLPNPATGETKVNLKAAASVLDSLEMLAIKTKGNLTAEEDELLEKALINIRALYANVENL